MALQGRKPGWLLDRLLGRDEAETPKPEGPVAEQDVHAPHPEALGEAEPRRTLDMGASFEASLREAPQDEDVQTSEPKAIQPSVLSPSSASEGHPDFMPAALDPTQPPAPGGVEDASPDERDTLPDELAGATLQPVAFPSAATPEEPKRNWLRRLADGMRRTSSAIGDNVTSLFTKKKLDRATLEDLEDVLVGADLGIETASRIATAIGAGRYDREIEPAEVKAIMAGEIETVLAPVALPLAIDRAKKPFVLLTVGVNGAGKTTTIGKLAQKFRAEGASVVIAAGDTFRAAAIEQLKVWGERVGAPVIARPQGSDAASLAFEALEEARNRGADILMIDTAGRLQNKAGLMAELEKIIRVLKKLDPEAPHATLLVLDATVGQNAISQVELFRKSAGVTGLVMTKLDGTARGGILVALAAKFGLPIHFIGVGEGVDDLEPFTARDFSRAIAGLDAK